MHEPQPTIIAMAVLVGWPCVALWLFASHSRPQALLWTVLGGYLLLPTSVAITLPGLPDFDKTASIALAAIAGALASGWRPRLRPQFGLVGGLVLLYVFGPLVTSYLNSNPILVGGRVLPGAGLYDGLSAVVAQLFTLVPFFLGREMLRRDVDCEQLLRALVVAGLIYSVPMLYELRMSPQLHNMVYGFFQSSFATEGRYGGFRPVVFLPNGLVLALFTAVAVMAAVALWRSRAPVLGLPRALPAVYLTTLLVLCKSLGALVIGLTLSALIRFGRPQLQARVAVLLVTIVLAYPTLRAMDLIPTDGLVGWAATVSEERAGSLKTRFDQEEALLDRASERFWFGWGRYGRSRVYDETGKDISLTDGQWIITMGSFGFVGFLAAFGLLAVPVFRSARVVALASRMNHGVHISALALIVAAIAVDQLPNASLGPWSWLLGGALLGQAEALRAARSAPTQATGRSRPNQERPGHNRSTPKATHSSGIETSPERLLVKKEP